MNLNTSALNVDALTIILVESKKRKKVNERIFDYEKQVVSNSMTEFLVIDFVIKSNGALPDVMFEG